MVRERIEATGIGASAEVFGRCAGTLDDQAVVGRGRLPGDLP